MYMIACFITVDDLMSEAFEVQLSSSLLRTCLSARTLLLFAQGKDTFRFLREPPSSECSSPEQCRIRPARILSFSLARKRISPLAYFPPPLWTELLNQHFCPSCLTEARREYEDSRRRVWDQLPEIFGLPSWDELKAARDADLAGRD
ncbi:hypothetical protein FB45DRAFT_875825 [Roridomyces roridus]|uniref:Uncharacterized protein n=1 Tax=Roridomyces roridus TaxID=1738132 RepID=A0AAD7B4M2_9AGAR|nr:hypothetical protein FB45DRAFT_875825 [Roridomyces roridus]